VIALWSEDVNVMRAKKGKGNWYRQTPRYAFNRFGPGLRNRDRSFADRNSGAGVLLLLILWREVSKVDTGDTDVLYKEVRQHRCAHIICLAARALPVVLLKVS